MGWSKHVETLWKSVEAVSPGDRARTDVPPEVMALAVRAGVSTAAAPRVVRLAQRGEMWRSLGASPLRFAAHQVIAVGRAGFVWDARFQVAGATCLRVVDYLVGANGGIEARLLGAIPFFAQVGTPETFRGEAMRYLGELMWNPDALAFNPDLQWRILSPSIYAVSLGEGPRHSEVRLILDQAGDVARIEADDRPRQEGSGLTMCPWFGRCRDYRTIGGHRIPLVAEAGWVENGREFVYWRGRIESWSVEG